MPKEAAVLPMTRRYEVCRAKFIQRLDHPCNIHRDPPVHGLGEPRFGGTSKQPNSEFKHSWWASITAALCPAMSSQ